MTQDIHDEIRYISYSDADDRRDERMERMIDISGWVVFTSQV